ncbi:hypothetical protein CRENBAI_012665 [Crenichthys baileyi]|uniref:Uncharacterized protein n=1 Tax=Crenichthys baileyi TaxID=28760 RepID=A0AAV9SBN4_9TELE
MLPGWFICLQKIWWIWRLRVAALMSYGKLQEGASVLAVTWISSSMGKHVGKLHIPGDISCNKFLLNMELFRVKRSKGLLILLVQKSDAGQQKKMGLLEHIYKSKKNVFSIVLLHHILEG